MKVIFRLFKKAKKYWRYLILSVFAMFGITLTQLYTPWVMRELTKLATNGSQEIAKKSLEMGLMLLLAYAIQAFCQYIKSYYTHYAAWNFVADLRGIVYDKLQQLSLKYYHDKQTGQLMSRIINDTSDVELLIAHAVPDLIVNILIFISVAVMLFYINVKLAVISLFSIPFLAVGSVVYSKYILPKFRLRQKVLGQLNGTLQDNISGIKEIQVFNQQKHETQKVTGLAREHAHLTISALRLSAIYHPIIQFFSSMGIVLIISYGGFMASKGQIPIADIVAFVLYLGIFYQPITTLARVNEDLQAALASSERIFEVLDQEPVIYEKPDAIVLPKSKGGIEFKNVDFSYNETISVLKNINIKINPGEIVALVGPTGVGKTTVISLINRFYDPVKGDVFIDGVNIKDVTLKSLRENTSIVLQDVFLFSGTVAENIAYSLPGATLDQIVEAAKTARAHEFISELEDGYNTFIGERGVKLSGGQKQRLSIARAVLRDCPILILDEATAAVDVETEKMIQEAMNIIMENRTTILIAHRLSTVKKADKIIVLNEGEIEEIGTHDELMAKNGLYANLAKIQYSLSD